MREELDFKSLRFFSALYRLGNVSPTAEALNISQPTGSLLLKKLRDHFDDPLFVRIGQRMIPTPRADNIAPTIFTLLQLADNELPGNPEFSPQTSTRNFTIGYLMQLPDSTYQQRLFNQSYVCLTAENHPRIHSTFTAEHWRKEKHLAIHVNGTGHGDIDKLLNEHGMPRHVALTLPSFLGTGELVAGSELVAVVPEQLARHIVKRYPCRNWPLPFSLPEIAIRQVWHQRLHRDPGHIWLRSLIASITADNGG